MRPGLKLYQADEDRDDLAREGMAMQPDIDLSTNPQAKVQVAIDGPKRAPTQG
jgi:hypothetical protein